MLRPKKYTRTLGYSHATMGPRKKSCHFIIMLLHLCMYLNIGVNLDERVGAKPPYLHPSYCSFSKSGRVMLEPRSLIEVYASVCRSMTSLLKAFWKILGIAQIFKLAVYTLVERWDFDYVSEINHVKLRSLANLYVYDLMRKLKANTTRSFNVWLSFILKTTMPRELLDIPTELVSFSLINGVQMHNETTLQLITLPTRP